MMAQEVFQEVDDLDLYIQEMCRVDPEFAALVDKEQRLLWLEILASPLAKSTKTSA